ncbi:9244_t:CDS:2 [Paraglomus occultum]|uniref:mRNA-capping enzyme subunit beta n=1 Tax=Paraglomus occultum TaxID=144539 RepID=A0A9N8VNK7_9GLOM|nr:9244_t:CDS:2 [Paraglomus occultum]
MSRKRLRTEDTDQTDQTPTEAVNDNMPLLPRRLELSILGGRPVNDLVKVVSDFLYKYINEPNIEIEAKLGVLIDKNTKNRLFLPVACEAVIDPNDSLNSRLTFSSDMTLEQHKSFNEILNKRFSETHDRNYQGARMTYIHTKDTDRFYNIERGGRVRVTTRKGQVIENGIVEKSRLANLNIFSPRTRLDYRITVNIETPRELPTGRHHYERIKDRMSYTHQIFKFDLTQVTIPETKNASGRDPRSNKELTHELEIEFIDPRVLLIERQNFEKKRPDRFIEIVEIFLNNIQQLVQYAG